MRRIGRRILPSLDKSPKDLWFNQHSQNRKKGENMCDYSLHSVHNRLAVEGEPLQVHKFPTGSLGLASTADLQPAISASSGGKGWWQTVKGWFETAPPVQVAAVCIPPGARLILREIPKSFQEKLGVSAEEEVTFVQLSPEIRSYRDAVRFSNGKEVLIQRLPLGQQLDVLGLSIAEEEPKLTQTIERIATASHAMI